MFKPTKKELSVNTHHNTVQKIKFSINIFFSKCDQIRTTDLVTFTEQIFNRKLHFLCSVPAKFRFGKDVFLKTSWRRLEEVLKKTSCKQVFTRLEDVWKTSCRRLENVLKTSCEDVWTTSWRRFFVRRFANTSWKRLGRRKIVTLKTS